MDKLITNLAEVGTDLARTVKGFPVDADLLMLKVEEEYGFRARDRLYGIIRNMPKYELPPAEPKRGKWILDRSGAYCCSECMEPCAGYVMMKPRDKFCKMCGAKMEVTE